MEKKRIKSEIFLCEGIDVQSGYIASPLNPNRSQQSQGRGLRQ